MCIRDRLGATHAVYERLDFAGQPLVADDAPARQRAPPLAPGWIQPRIQVEGFLVLQRVPAGSAIGVKDKVPTAAGHRARNRNEVMHLAPQERTQPRMGVLVGSFKPFRATAARANVCGSVQR